MKKQTVESTLAHSDCSTVVYPAQVIVVKEVYDK